jgi:hypothetical protein
MQQQLILNPTFRENDDKIKAFDSIFLIGSCFSTEMYQKLQRRKFDVLSNPYGILFDTLSISRALEDIKNNKTYFLLIHNDFTFVSNIFCQLIIHINNNIFHV